MIDTVETTISKPLYKVLTDLTGEARLDIALHLATKDLVRLRLREVAEEIQRFEERYQRTFDAFQQAWEANRIAEKHSYEVERDYWEWEAAVMNRTRLQEILETMP